eukprot:1671558-Amphidinium_carterae.1
MHEILLRAVSWQELARARRWEYSHLLLQMMVHVGAVMLAFLMLFRISCGVADPDCTGRQPAWDSISLVCALVGCGLFFWAYPRFFTFRCRDVLHGLAIARLVWQTAAVGNPYLLVFQ